MKGVGVPHRALTEESPRAVDLTLQRQAQMHGDRLWPERSGGHPRRKLRDEGGDWVKRTPHFHKV